MSSAEKIYGAFGHGFTILFLAFAFGKIRLKFCPNTVTGRTVYFLRSNVLAVVILILL